jgi:AAA domain
MDQEMLPELRDNPFTRVLGMPPSLADRMALLDRPAPYEESERQLSHDQRKYALLRLFEVSVPVKRQVELVERIHMAIRQGYKARDPARGWHRAQHLASSSALAAIMEGRRDKSLGRNFNRAWEGDDPVGTAVEAVRNDLPALKGAGAHGFVLIGDPGMGKSTSTEITLAAMEQVVEPDTPYYLKQLVYVKIDCPAAPTRRQFCQAAFSAIDLALGTNYTSMFVAQKNSPEEMVARLQNVVVLHAVGIIVIDEIQNVAKAAEAPDTFLNFFVGLVNRLGVPLMMIGTAEARPLLDGAFRLARRAAGLGQPNWERLREGEEWEDWLSDMWRYQWTSTPTALTPDIVKAVYDECQGIIDIAVKLLMLAQLRAISRGEAGLPEALDARLFETVAREEFALARPLLRALRDGRMDVLANVPDLVPFQLHVDRLLSNAMGMTAQDFRDLRDARQKEMELRAKGDAGPVASFKANVMKRGYAAKVADGVVAEAFRRNPVDDVIGISSTISELLAGLDQPARAGNRVVRAVAPAVTSRIGDAVRDKEDVIEALREDGLLVSSVDDLLPPA